MTLCGFVSFSFRVYLIVSFNIVISFKLFLYEVCVREGGFFVVVVDGGGFFLFLFFFLFSYSAVDGTQGFPGT